MRIAFVGNFGSPHSTENDLAWTLGDMGHTVLTLQENNTCDTSILATAQQSDMVLFVHTHSWEPAGDMMRVLSELKAMGKPSVSFHLDLYRGLHREWMVGEHWFFKTQYFFGVDGGSEEFYRAKGVNHIWIKPGVVKRDCYLADPRPEYECDVAFVGSYGYHPEHSWRPQLIDWLRATYGERFKKFGNPEPTLRGHELNRFYASAKVVVGDSLSLGFNHPRYWSDRVYETTGRGGFLIMPEIEGLIEDVPRLVQYRFGDFDNLKQTIDAWVNCCDSRRNELRLSIHNHVKANCTYHNRMQFVLDTVFPK